MLSIKKCILLLFVGFILFMNYSFGQSEYIVNVSIQIFNGGNGVCTGTGPSIKAPSLIDGTTGKHIKWFSNADYIESGFIFNLWVVRPANSRLAIKYKDLKGDVQFIPFAINKATQITDSKKSWKFGGLCDRWSEVSLTANIYEPAPLRSSNLKGNNCIGNIHSNHTLTMKTSGTILTKYSIHKYLLQVSPDRTFPSSNTKEIELSQSSAINYKSYFDLSGSSYNSWYGMPLYFRTKTVLFSDSDDAAYSAISDSYYFFKQMPKPKTITTQRLACYPYLKINVTLDSSAISDIDNFKFRVIPDDCEFEECKESLSNIIRLIQYGSPNGNIVTFRPHTTDVDLLDESGTYTLQIFQNIQESGGDKTVSSKDISCAVKKSFSLDSILELPSFTATALPIDDTKYHTTRHDRSDGQIQLIIDNITSVTDRIWAYFGKAEPDSPDAWSGATSGTVNTWESIELDGITGATGIPPKSKWTLNDFEGDARYFIRLKDADGCYTATEPINLFKPEPITISVADNTRVVSCHANNAEAVSDIRNDGEISVRFSGGIPPYNILLDGSARVTNFDDTSGTATGLSEKNYNVQVSDKYGEISSGTTVSVTAKPEMVLSASPTDLTCFEGENGSVRLNVTEKGTAGITFALAGQNEQPSSGTEYTYPYLAAGTYSATVTNTNGCRAVASNISVGQPNDIVIKATGSKIARHGDHTGTISLEINEGTGDFDYTVFKQGGNAPVAQGTTSQNATISNLDDGYYWLEVTDDNTCLQTHSNIRVQQPDAPLALSFSQQPKDVDCHGNATGEVYPTATGGWGQYQFGVNGTNYGYGNTIGGLRASDYTVFVVDSEGVVDTLPITITEPTKLTSSVNKIHDLQCYEDNSGAVRLNISGGTSGYSISLDKINWVPGNALSNLPAMDNQSIYIQDAHNCSASQKISITQPELLKAKVDTLYDLLCHQDATGAIKLDVSGGTAPYAMSVNNIKWVENCDSVGGLQANADQHVWVRDAHGCRDSLVAAIAQPELLEASPSVEHLRCFKDNSGTITMNVLGGTAPYSISVDSINWLPGNIKPDMAANPAQTVYIRDTNNCLTKNTVAINQPEKLTTTIDSIYNLRCFNDGSGAVDLNIEGGTAPYSISDDAVNWVTGDYLDNLDAKPSLKLSIKDKNGCETYRTVSIAQPDKLVAETVAVYDLKCFEDNSGAVKLHISGGTGRYSVSMDNMNWIPGDSVPNLSAGNNQIIYIRDANNCPATEKITITQPDVLKADINTVYDLWCYQDASGALKLDISGGTAPFAISADKIAWENADSIGGLQANANQHVWVRDNHGCTDSLVTSISEPDLLEATPIVEHLKCFEDSSGTITMDVLGGTAPYSLSLDSTNWVPGSFISGLAASAALNVFIRDTNNCLTKNTVAINQPEPFTSAIDSVHHLRCFNDSSGAVELSFNGGTAPYWISDGTRTVSGNYIDKLDADSALNLTAEDANGCIYHQQLTVTQPEKLVASADKVHDLKCFGDNSGAVTIAATGGTFPYEVSPDSATWHLGNTLSNLSAAELATFYLRDSNDCETSVSASINQPPKLHIRIDTVIDAYCNQSNGQINLSVSGGTIENSYKYRWYNQDAQQETTGDTSLANLYSGRYALSVSDDNVCRDSISIIVSNLDGPVLNAWSFDSVTCYGGSDGAIYIDSISGGGGIYALSLNNQPFIDRMTNLRAGKQYLKITDNKGCAVYAYLEVPQPDSLGYVLTERMPSCNGMEDGLISVELKGGNGRYSYSWTDGEASLTRENLASDWYNLAVADRNGCKNSFTFFLDEPEPLSVTAGLVPPLCSYSSDGRIQCVPAGGNGRYNFLWNSGEHTASISQLKGGEYSLRVTDKKGCRTDTSFMLSAPDTIKLTASTTDPSCYRYSDGAISIIATGGTASYYYLWSTGSRSGAIEGLNTGSYSVTVQDGNNCQAKQSFRLVEPAKLAARAIIVDPECYGDHNGKIITSVYGGNGNYQFAWDDNSTESEISNLSRGTYTVSITDAKACSLTKVFAVNEPDSLGFTFSKTMPSCTGMADGALSLKLTGGNGGYSYSWADGETALSRSNLQSALYSLSVSDRLGCAADFDIFLDEPEPLTAHISSVPPLCNYSSDGRIICVPSGGNGGYNFLWNTGSTAASIKQLPAGVYSLRLTDAKNCIADTSISLSAPDALIINPELAAPACFGDANGSVSVSLTGGTGSYKYWWNTGSTSEHINGLRKGTYSILARDANNCEVSGNYSLQEPEALSVVADIIEPTCKGYSNGSISAEALGGNGSYTYRWESGLVTPDIAQLTKGEYSLTVTDSKNCQLFKVFPVGEPAPVRIQANITAPTCHDSDNGIVELNASGGSGGYSYTLNGIATGKILTSLAEGSYPVIATDINNCSGTNIFALNAPMPPTAHLRQNAGVLCTGNSLELDGGDFVSHQWYKDAVGLSRNRYLTVDQTGQYTLKITDERGCAGLDTFDLEVSDTPLDATLLLQDSALVNEVVRAVDVTWPVPDSVQWYFDTPVELAGNNSYSQNFSKNTTGTVNVTLRAWYGGCYSDSSKSVTVYYEAGKMPQKSIMNQPLILGYKAYPNPSIGDFYIAVELSRKADISLHLYNASTGADIGSKREYGLDSYAVPFNLTGLKQGVYFIVLAAGQEQQRLKIVIE